MLLILLCCHNRSSHTKKKSRETQHIRTQAYPDQTCTHTQNVSERIGMNGTNRNYCCMPRNVTDPWLSLASALHSRSRASVCIFAFIQKQPDAIRAIHCLLHALLWVHFKHSRRKGRYKVDQVQNLGHFIFLLSGTRWLCTYAFFFFLLCFVDFCWTLAHTHIHTHIYTHLKQTVFGYEVTFWSITEVTWFLHFVIAGGVALYII